MILSGLTLWCVTVQQHIEHKDYTAVLLRLFGGDVDCNDCLTVLVFGFTDVVSKVDGLHVLYCEYAC